MVRRFDVIDILAGSVSLPFTNMGGMVICGIPQGPNRNAVIYGESMHTFQVVEQSSKCQAIHNALEAGSPIVPSAQTSDQ